MGLEDGPRGGENGEKQLEGENAAPDLVGVREIEGEDLILVGLGEVTQQQEHPFNILSEEVLLNGGRNDVRPLPGGGGLRAGGLAGLVLNPLQVFVLALLAADRISGLGAEIICLLVTHQAVSIFARWP